MTEIIECLRCGKQRDYRADECPRCGYVGWARSSELDERDRRRLRKRPSELRPLRSIAS